MKFWTTVGIGVLKKFFGNCWFYGCKGKFHKTSVLHMKVWHYLWLLFSNSTEHDLQIFSSVKKCVWVTSGKKDSLKSVLHRKDCVPLSGIFKNWKELAPIKFSFQQVLCYMEETKGKLFTVNVVNDGTGGWFLTVFLKFSVNTWMMIVLIFSSKTFIRTITHLKPATATGIMK